MSKEVETCPACEGDESVHDCDWTNEDCPEQCNEEHEVNPEEMLRCPVSGGYWRYCSRCGWEVVSRYSGDPHYVHGELLCDPYEHGYERCSDCRTWVDQDYAYYSERNECYYCEGCYDAYGRDGGHSTDDPMRTAPCCGTPNVNLHLLTEDFLCHCKAVHAHHAGQPVEFHDGTTLATLRQEAA